MEKIKKALCVAVASLVIIQRRRRMKRRSKRSCWVRPWLARRGGNRDAFALLTTELRTEDPNEYKNFICMDEQCFAKVLSAIKEKIVRQDTNMREAISPERRLALTLRFLATGETFKSLAFAQRISGPSISKIVMEVCKAICEELRDTYLKARTTETEWKQISKNFNDMWEFPNCLGALDGKHIAFAPPKRDGSYFFNYKEFNSIVLLAVVDAKYKFQLVDIGCNGRISDGGVFSNSRISAAIKENKLNFPPPECLPGSEICVPHVFVADDAFGLHQNILKPYKDCGSDTKKKKVFNYRLSRARRVVENAFGILANRFRILLGTIRLPVEKVDAIVETVVILHNFLLHEKERMYTAGVDVEDTEQCSLSSGLWRSDRPLLGLPHQGGNRTSVFARNVRDQFCEYFNGVGFVPWQWESVKKFNF